MVAHRGCHETRGRFLPATRQSPHTGARDEVKVCFSFGIEEGHRLCRHVVGSNPEGDDLQLGQTWTETYPSLLNGDQEGLVRWYRIKLGLDAHCMGQ